MGLGDLLRRRQRPRQARRRVRLALGARPEALRRPDARRRRVRRVAHRGPARAAGGRALHARHEHDPEGRRRAHRGADRRPRLRRERAAPARRAARAGPSTRPRCSPPSARSSATASAAAARATARRSPRCTSRSGRARDHRRPPRARPRQGALPAEGAAEPRGRRLPATYAARTCASSRPTPDAPWLGGAGRGLAVETIAPEEVFTLRQGKRG